MEEILISIVSTNQTKLVEKLCSDFLKNKIKHKIIITLNGKRENLQKLSKYKNRLNINFVKNNLTLGFAENHNNAFKQFKSKYFVIMNPDLRVESLNLSNLKNILKENNDIKLVSPKILDYRIFNYHNYRKFPGVFSPILRKFFKKNLSDYKLKKKINYVDWVSGMFMMIDSSFFKKIGYFDENFYLYYEDVDICKRVGCCQKKVAVVKTFQNKIIHFSRRDSHRNFKYFIFHMKSLIYYHCKFKNFNWLRG